MRSHQYYMLSFESTHQALAAQRFLQPRVPVGIMPTLRAVQAGCGISLRVEPDGFAPLKKALEAMQSGGWRLYFVEGETAPRVTPVDL